MSKIRNIKLGVRPKRKDLFYNEHIKNQNINKVPDYYNNMAGNPYVGRMDRSVAVTENLLKVTKIITIVEETNESGNLSVEVNHDLGRRPYIIGTYEILSVGDEGSVNPERLGTRGTFPDFRLSSGVWVTRIDNVTNNTFNAVVSIEEMGTGTIQMKFYVLRETLFDDI